MNTLEPLSENPKPLAMTERDFGVGVRRSFMIHAVIAAFILVKSLVFPGNPVRYVPTLRVDIVDLPDILKKDLAQHRKTSPSLPAAEQLSQAQKDAEKISTEPKTIKNVKEPPLEPPDPMVLHPKKTLVKKNKYALARIKALEKLGLNGSVLVKGNAISKGSSLSGDAKEASEENYFDTLREKLQENWALPVWLSRQNLSARVQIFLDARGRLRNFQIIKFSGNGQFDEAVKKSIQESAPFPPPPSALASSVSTTGVMVGFPL